MNEFSKHVYKYITENHIELLDSLETEKSDFGNEYLIIEMVSVNKNVSSNLYISTEDNLITVGFHNFHCHYYELNDLRNAFEIFFKIKAEEYLVVNYGLLKFEQIECIEKGKIIEGLSLNAINYYVTSWSGKYDKILENKNFQNLIINERKK